MAIIKKKWFWIGTITVLSIAGLLVIPTAFTNSPGAEIRVESVDRQDLVSVVTASGVIQPKRKVDISSDITGRVVTLAVEDGQYVDRGDLLLRIDPTKYRAAVRRAEAEVAQARAQASRARAEALRTSNSADRSSRLHSQDTSMISVEEIERVRTAADVAQADEDAARFGVDRALAALTEAQDNLRKTTITAPRAGRVTRVNIEEGETAVVGTMNNPGSLLLTIADLSVMEASVRVDETDVLRIDAGDSATVHVDALPNQSLSGRVTRISNSAIQTSQARGSGESVDYEVIITLDNPPGGLRPDLSATAEIVVDQRPQALTVPIIAVTVRGEDGQSSADADLEGVFLFEEGTVRFTPVEVGITGDRYFEVESGLRGGEIVVAGPYSQIRSLQDGDAVHVTTGPTETTVADEANVAADAR